MQFAVVHMTVDPVAHKVIAVYETKAAAQSRIYLESWKQANAFNRLRDRKYTAGDEFPARKTGPDFVKEYDVQEIRP